MASPSIAGLPAGSSIPAATPWTGIATTAAASSRQSSTTVRSVVFGGFSARELATGIDDAAPKVVVAGSCGIEPTRTVPYKPLLDQTETGWATAANCLGIEPLPMMSRIDDVINVADPLKGELPLGPAVLKAGVEHRPDELCADAWRLYPVGGRSSAGNESGPSG